MSSRTWMLQARVDGLKPKPPRLLRAAVLPYLPDAVRIILTRVAAEGGLPVGLVSDPAAYEAWFRAKVGEALDDPHPPIPHDKAMRDLRARIEEPRSGT